MTVERVRAAVTLIMESESRRRRAEGLIHGWQLTREDLDEAAHALGTPPVTDEEWNAIQDGRGIRVRTHGTGPGGPA
ncbi:hypothetical protein AB0O34_22880 [Sphaerisporangium sp. NPDC088356]|uniref:hypothetical protein n=1 Tax=Sphaerisporangium sp. NPDC088356 TaxID=3154871 RepID=UPI00343E1B29